jgi:hypothetical protein
VYLSSLGQQHLTATGWLSALPWLAAVAVGVAAGGAADRWAALGPGRGPPCGRAALHRPVCTPLQSLAHRRPLPSDSHTPRSLIRRGVPTLTVRRLFQCASFLGCAASALPLAAAAAPSLGLAVACLTINLAFYACRWGPGPGGSYAPFLLHPTPTHMHPFPAQPPLSPTPTHPSPPPTPPPALAASMRICRTLPAPRPACCRASPTAAPSSRVRRRAPRAARRAPRAARRAPQPRPGDPSSLGSGRAARAPPAPVSRPPRRLQHLPLPRPVCPTHPAPAPPHLHPPAALRTGILGNLATGWLVSATGSYGSVFAALALLYAAAAAMWATCTSPDPVHAA